MGPFLMLRWQNEALRFIGKRKARKDNVFSAKKNSVPGAVTLIHESPGSPCRGDDHGARGTTGGIAGVCFGTGSSALDEPS